MLGRMFRLETKMRMISLLAALFAIQPIPMPPNPVTPVGPVTPVDDAPAKPKRMVCLTFPDTATLKTNAELIPAGVVIRFRVTHKQLEPQRHQYVDQPIWDWLLAAPGRQFVVQVIGQSGDVELNADKTACLDGFKPKPNDALPTWVLTADGVDSVGSVPCGTGLSARYVLYDDAYAGIINELGTHLAGQFDRNPQIVGFQPPVGLEASETNFLARARHVLNADIVTKPGYAAYTDASILPVDGPYTEYCKSVFTAWDAAFKETGIWVTVNPQEPKLPYEFNEAIIVHAAGIKASIVTTKLDTTFDADRLALDKIRNTYGVYVGASGVTTVGEQNDPAVLIDEAVGGSPDTACDIVTRGMRAGQVLDIPTIEALETALEGVK